jgi:hypothetical protein
MDNRLSSKKRFYDDARNHFLGNFPNVPIEQAYIHIGMYMGWIIESALYSEYFEEEGSNQIFRFKRKEISCTILSEIWDGHLQPEIINDLGNMFTTYYYESGLYNSDYSSLLVKDLPSKFHVTDTWENYEKIKQVINARFTEWKQSVN